MSTLQDQRAIRALKSGLSDEDSYVRKTVLGSLMELRGDKTDIRLISPFFVDLGICDQDPKAMVTEERMEKDAKRLGLSLAEARKRYEKFAQEFGLQLEWMQTSE